jgi:hypothetical protein
MKRSVRYPPSVILVILLCAILVAALLLNAHRVIQGLGAWFGFAFVSTAYLLAWNARFFAAGVTGVNRAPVPGPGWNPTSTAQNLHSEIVAGKCRNLASLDQALFFAAVVAAPNGDMQRRIVEEYVPLRHALRKSVTVNVEIPDETFRALDGKDLLIPVTVSNQVVPYDDLKVDFVGGEKISTLTDPEHIRLVSCILHLLLASVRRRRFTRSPEGLMQAVEVEAINDIICHVGLEAEHPHNGQNTAQKIRNLIGISDAKSAPILRSAAAMVSILTSHRCKVLRIPAPESPVFSFKYECTLTSMGGPGKWWLAKLGDFGATLRWKTVRMWLNDAAFCETYHVTVRPSENLYSIGQEIKPEGYMNIPRSSNLGAPYSRFRRIFGQSYTNFYGRFLQAHNIRAHTNASIPRGKTPLLVAEFAEVPPGSLFISFLAAATSAVLIWVAAIAVKHFSADGTDIHSDLPVLILAFPGVAAAWLGFDTTDSKLFEGSFIARLSLFLTAIISLLATVLYIGFHKSGSKSGEGQLMMLGIADRWWWGLTVAATCNAALLCYLWLLNWWRYKRFKGNA